MSPLRVLTILIAIAACATPGMSQTILFEEDFNSGIPTSWRNQQLNWHGDPWEARVNGSTNGGPEMFHEWFAVTTYAMVEDLYMDEAIDSLS